MFSNNKKTSWNFHQHLGLNSDRMVPYLKIDIVLVLILQHLENEWRINH
jgi:hypothetical protein